jgi:predicted secreted protein
MTIRYRVEPPAYTSDYAADFWKAWLTGKDVELVDKKAEYVKPAVEPKMTHAYFPDESPHAYAITEIDTVFVPRG